MTDLRRARRLLSCLVAALLGLVVAPALAMAQGAPSVAAFPSPGTHYNLPATQITFRGISPGKIGPVRVVGSVTGVHSGRMASDSDGQGASFLPDKPFASGETVTVSTGMNIIGASNGTFSFGISHFVGLIPYGKIPVVSAGSNGLQHFRSRPDLEPPAITVTKNSAPAADGDFFIAAQFGPAQNGPMILDSRGNVVWFQRYPVSENLLITDFRVQNLYGQPVLTWWQGNTNSGHGRGEGVIFNQNYQQIATVHAGNGLDEGLHEFLVTPNGDAYFTASDEVGLPGVGKPAIDQVVQEVDIKTGLVLFEWHALDHIPLSASYFTPKSPGYTFDPYHINSVNPDRSGNLLVSMRDTSAVYDINPQTGAINWTLGGKQSSFKMGPGTSTWGQHDALMQPDGTITLFDDGGGPPTVRDARGIRERIDTTHMTATLLTAYPHSPQIPTNFEGSTQVLPSGNVVLGWGQQPYFSEDNASGQQIFDAHFNVPTTSYRAYRFVWNAQPPTAPALAVAPNSDGSVSLYASWNGATDVSSWRVLGGASVKSLAVLGTAGKGGFETRILEHSAEAVYEVQALGSSGQVLASSPAQATPSHLALYGRSVFVSGGGFAGVPASCFAARDCHITTTVTAGRTVIARSGRERIARDGAGLLYFQLSSAGRRLLARARGARLGVRISERDSSGMTASANFTLVPFSSAGRGPRKGAAQARGLQFVGLTDFVASNGVGGILAECLQDAPCHVRTSVSVGRTVLASTGPESLGGHELGYLIFSLTRTGATMLARASGNQLGATVRLTAAGATASGQLALVRFR